MRLILVACLTAVSALACARGGEQTATLRQAAAEQPVRPVAEVVFCTQPPVIDGDLSDASWKNAVPLASLQPARGGKYQDKIAARPTEIRLLWDADNLYVCFSCKDEDIFCTGTIAHDGNIYQEDVCEVFLDAKGDSRQWIEMQVNARNQTLDLMSLYLGDTAALTASGRFTPDALSRELWSFRGWEAEGLRTASGRLLEGGTVVGWTVEMAIPAKNITKRLGGGALKPCSFRANFVRYDHPLKKDGTREMLFMNWSPVENGCPHISPAAMGVLNLKEPHVQTP